MADPRTSEEVRGRVQELRAMLDPVRLLKEIRAIQQQLVDIAGGNSETHLANIGAIPLRAAHGMVGG